MSNVNVNFYFIIWFRSQCPFFLYEKGNKKLFHKMQDVLRRNIEGMKRKKKNCFSLLLPCVRVPFGAAKRLTASTRSRGARETLATFYYFPSLSLPIMFSPLLHSPLFSQELELLKLVCLVRFLLLLLFLPVLYEREEKRSWVTYPVGQMQFCQFMRMGIRFVVSQFPPILGCCRPIKMKKK